MFSSRKLIVLGLLLLLLLLLIGELEASHQQHCKKVVRKAFERCLGVRNKRNTPDEPLPNLPQRRKRDIMSIREIILSSRMPVVPAVVPVYDIPYPQVHSFSRRDNVPIVPPVSSEVLQTERTVASLPQENGSELGFDITSEDLLELVNELLNESRSQRRARADDAFMNSVMECCKNENLCLQNEILPCGI